jgi:hypothetical protein
MISQYIEIIPTVALDFYRRVVKDIESESDEVKSQSLNFALKIFQGLETADYEQKTKEKAQAIINFHLEKLFYDKNYYIREKSRLVKVLLIHNKSLKDENMLKAIEEIEKSSKEGILRMEDSQLDTSSSNNLLMSLTHYVKLSGLEQKFVISHAVKNSGECLTIEDYLKSPNLMKTKTHKGPTNPDQDKKYDKIGSGGNTVSETYKNTEINIEEKKKQMLNDFDKFLEKAEDHFEAEIEEEN